jgi:hypothetical protein
VTAFARGWEDIELYRKIKKSMVKAVSPLETWYPQT